MQEIELKSIETYQKNLEYFSKNHTDILNKIQALNSAIDDNKYTPKYDLEYMQDYFDVKEIQSGEYLYNDNSNKISNKLLNLVNFNKDSYLFDGFPLYYNYEQGVGQFTDRAIGLKGLFPIMTYYLDNSHKSDDMKVVEKFIFIGVGLGLHIPLIDKKIRTLEYLIIEDDLELFNLSLFCTPYYEFSEDVLLHFSIAEEDNRFTNDFGRFIADSWFLNRYIKYSYFPAHSNHKIKLIQDVLSSQDFTIFHYGTFLRKQLRPLEYINNGYNIVDFSEHFKDTVFSTKPVLIVAAGPSLQKNIKWLEDNHDKFIIVAVSSIVNLLYKLDIAPDIVIQLDGYNISATLFDGFPAQEFLKNSIFLFGSFVSKEVRELFKKEQCFYLEEDAYYFEGFTSSSASCVGSTSILHSIMLDTHNTYLLGLNFSVDNETGRTHSSSHWTKSQADLSTKDELKDNMSSWNNIFPIKGNLRDTVYINSVFNRSVQNLYAIIPRIKRDYQNIYNLNDGAYLNKTIPTKIEEVKVEEFPIIDKVKLNLDIIDTFKAKSSQNLSKSDVESLKKRLDTAKEIKEHILQYKNNVSLSNSNTYLYDALGIISKILHYNGREANNLVGTYNLFFKYALPLIMDLLNTKGLKNTKRHIKKLDKMLVAEMLRIVDVYTKTIEDFIKDRKL